MKIAVTGYTGFIGVHLVNSLIYKNNFNKQNLNFINKEDFDDPHKLKQKLKDCDTVIHLAGVNRHNDSEFIYQENIRLTKLLIESISAKTKTVLFSSSIQQDMKNSFGQSKLKCKQLFEDWSKLNNIIFINLKIPNVFGPFGKPNYNSFISTFCYNIVNGEKIEHISKNEIKLIFIDDLVKEILDCIHNPKTKNQEISKFNNIIYTHVDVVHEILRNQWKYYINENTIPEISSELERNLFNTLRSYITLENFKPRKLTKHIDRRGFFSEILRTKGQGQFSFSKTFKGITRGNHFHTKKIERFIVIEGEAEVNLRRVDSNKVSSFKLSGLNLDYIDIPIWYSHNIKNIGDDKLLTLFWINEPYDPENTDTFNNVV